MPFQNKWMGHVHFEHVPSSLGSFVRMPPARCALNRSRVAATYKCNLGCLQNPDSAPGIGLRFWCHARQRWNSPKHGQLLVVQVKVELGKAGSLHTGLLGGAVLSTAVAIQQSAHGEQAGDSTAEHQVKGRTA